MVPVVEPDQIPVTVIQIRRISGRPALDFSLDDFNFHGPRTRCDGSE